MILNLCLAFWIPYFLLSFYYFIKDDDKTKYSKCLPLVLFNAFIIFPLFISLILPFVHLSSKFCFLSSGIQLLSNLIIFEFLFYLFHKLFHIKFLYKQFHKIHHQYTKTIGLAGIYAHPLDFIICNLIPGSTGFYLFNNIHVFTVFIWIMLSSSYVVISHSILNFHTYHHHLLNKNFGTLKIMDFIFKTLKLVILK